MPDSFQPIDRDYGWSTQGLRLHVAWSCSGGDGTPWLLLPALSRIASRRERQPFCAARLERQEQGGEAPRLISVDWPGSIALLAAERTGLTPEGIAGRQRLSRQPGGRFASAAFVTGGLDPDADGGAWLAAAAALQTPLTVVIADQAPPKSLAAMQSLAAVADRTLHLPGRPGAHEECGRDLASLLRGC
jgi:hypothetical protein